jgi:hypothetical protein
VSRLGLKNNPQVLKIRHIEPHTTSTFIPPAKEDEKEDKVHAPKSKSRNPKERNKHHPYSWTIL